MRNSEAAVYKQYKYTLYIYIFIIHNYEVVDDEMGRFRPYEFHEHKINEKYTSNVEGQFIPLTNRNSQKSYY